MGNHWNDNSELVIEEKTLFRQVGWLSHNGTFFDINEEEKCRALERNGYKIPYSPVYIQIATWVPGEGWHD